MKYRYECTFCFFIYHFIITIEGYIQKATVDQAHRDHFWKKRCLSGRVIKVLLWELGSHCQAHFDCYDSKSVMVSVLLSCIYVGSKPLFFIGMFYLGWWSYKNIFVKLLCPLQKIHACTYVWSNQYCIKLSWKYGGWK